MVALARDYAHPVDSHNPRVKCCLLLNEISAGNIAIGYPAGVSRMSALLAASIIYEGFPKLMTLARLRSKLMIFVNVVTRRTRLGAEIS